MGVVKLFEELLDEELLAGLTFGMEIVLLFVELFKELFCVFLGGFTIVVLFDGPIGGLIIVVLLGGFTIWKLLVWLFALLELLLVLLILVSFALTIPFIDGELNSTGFIFLIFTNKSFSK